MSSKKTVNMNLHDWNPNEAFTVEELAYNFEAIDSEFRVRGINANWKGAKGDGITDDTVALTNAFNTLKSGDCLVFPPGAYYKTTRAGFLYTFSGKKDLRIEGNGATIEVIEQGLSFTYCDGLTVSGLKVVRSSQALWGAAKTGLYFGYCSNTDVSRNEVSKFTDGIGMNDCRIFRIYKNTLHHLGEEPVVTRTSKQVEIEDNEVFAYLGDGILNKGTTDLIIARNFLHDPINKDLDAVMWETMSGGNAAAPAHGGGITCNAESGAHSNDNMTIEDNRIFDTAFGIILSGLTVAKVMKNRLVNVVTTAITVSDNPNFNPYLVPGWDIDISYNTVQGLAKKNPRAVIQVRTGAVTVNYATIAFNRIYPDGPHKAIFVSGDVLVTGNTIKGAEVGIELLNGAKASNNFILDAYQPEVGRSLSLYDHSSAVQNTIKSSVPVIVSGKNIIMALNTISNSSLTLYAVFLQADAEGNQIINNSITSSGLKEIKGASSDWRDKNTYYGCISRAGVQYCFPPAAPRISVRPTTIDTGLIPGITYLDNVIGKPIVWSGSKWIESNSGKALFNGDGQTVTVVIPHGLSVRPTSYFVNAASQDSGIARVRDIDANAQYIVVRFETAPIAGVNNVALTWFAESK
ncbi:hypothetical protein PaecuDRAFT_1547 [Paenibacillus curdlanolyticus YK9]|uniref:Periplasmic copper-binding protein NosD beta helix domain-containing protein n=1 Tax=Paenibacillus curdlanolyticus YK9 TaxID=717606 RepID=E0I7C3_9BACL|nr:right-handed parallel beta-helix repeat-containing protein [Paenibacillus curdlanolyticus]EFM11939.1 hypothetical protein PaecuDRAFT_1547 [Paenibacillus curdlanolyticus YK9]